MFNRLCSDSWLAKQFGLCHWPVKQLYLLPVRDEVFRQSGISAAHECLQTLAAQQKIVHVWLAWNATECFRPIRLKEHPTIHTTVQWLNPTFLSFHSSSDWPKHSSQLCSKASPIGTQQSCAIWLVGTICHGSWQLVSCCRVYHTKPPSSPSAVLSSVHVLLLFTVGCIGLRWLQWVCTAAGNCSLWAWTVQWHIHKYMPPWGHICLTPCE